MYRLSYRSIPTRPFTQSRFNYRLHYLPYFRYLSLYTRRVCSSRSFTRTRRESHLQLSSYCNFPNKQRWKWVTLLTVNDSRSLRNFNSHFTNSTTEGQFDFVIVTFVLLFLVYTIRSSFLSISAHVRIRITLVFMCWALVNVNRVIF